MDNSRKFIVLALMIAVTSAMEIQNAGSFPTGTDYQKEKEKEGQDPANYKKTYHKAIPGGSEHAEVIASNGPGSNSWSQTYSKHQSFGSADTQQSQDAMDRHNAIMSSIQKSMGGMGMGSAFG
uniref:Secreted protein n=1 Tax=Caenorhabditis tropicalis TaxID=1561998 RepID=A0A1I7U6N4_9PELO